MKIVLWIGSGENQKALANKLSQSFEIEAIVIEGKTKATKKTTPEFLSKVLSKILFPSISRTWNKLMNHYKSNYPAYPNTKIIAVDSINDEKSYQVTTSIQPDLIIVSGTQLIKGKLLELNPRLGIMNLHTGLSPYVKGGPNCTNWCIAIDQLHLIGNTVMWLNKKIDGGNIIATETTRFHGSESFYDVHLTVMEHAHDLYLRAIKLVLKENRNTGIAQNTITQGKTYYRKNWTLDKQFRLMMNFRNFSKKIRSENYKQEQDKLKVFPIKF